MVLGSKSFLFLRWDAVDQLLDRQRLPLAASAALSTQLAQRGDTAVAFQNAIIHRHQRGLKTSIVADQGVDQGLKLRESFQGGCELRLGGLGGQVMGQVRTM